MINKIKRQPTQAENCPYDIWSGGVLQQHRRGPTSNTKKRAHVYDTKQ